MNALRQSRLGNVSAVAKRGTAVLEKKQTMGRGRSSFAISSLLRRRPGHLRNLFICCILALSPAPVYFSDLLGLLTRAETGRKSISILACVSTGLLST
jgi:hypothetical protein